MRGPFLEIFSGLHDLQFPHKIGVVLVNGYLLRAQSAGILCDIVNLTSP